MRKFFWLMPLVTMAAARAQSSPSIPINSGSVDYVTTITSSIDNLVASDSPAFLSMGNQLLTAIAIIMLVIYGLKWALHSASRHHPEFDFPGVVHFFAMFLVAEMMMRYYNSPLPWTSSSFHQLLPDTGRQLAGIIDLSSLNNLLAAIDDATHKAQKPDNDFLLIFVYVCVLIDMVLVEGVLFAVTILGFIAIGIGSLLGPLFIPWLICAQAQLAVLELDSIYVAVQLLSCCVQRTRLCLSKCDRAVLYKLDPARLHARSLAPVNSAIRNAQHRPVLQHF